MTDYYKVLGVEKNATPDDIKKAYRRLARKYHPDVSTEPNAEAKFKELQEAYRVLKDPVERGRYDRPQQKHDQWSHYDGGRNDDFGFKNNRFWRFDDFFDEVRMKEYIAVLTLEEAYAGKTVGVNGDVVVLPKGVHDGARFITEKRECLVVMLQPHHKFKRSGNDLLVLLNISFAEATFGCTAEVKHLDGNVLRFKIPKGIQPGQVIRLSQKGMPDPVRPRTGDLLVQVNISIPQDTSKLTDEEQKAIMKTGYRDTVTY